MITGEVVISYPVLDEPKANLSGVLCYGACLLIDKTDKKTLAEIDKAVKAAIEKGKSAKWGGHVPKFRYEPVRDGDAEIASGEKKPGMGYEGRMFVNTSADINHQPGCIGPNGLPFDPSKIYAGYIVRAEIRAFPYKNGGNCGIGWGINNVLAVRDCDPKDRLDGRQEASVAFKDFIKESADSDPADDMV
jgi:hypothetical protein